MVKSSDIRITVNVGISILRKTFYLRGSYIIEYLWLKDITPCGRPKQIFSVISEYGTVSWKITKIHGIRLKYDIWSSDRGFFSKRT